jgi:hypothetical protein
MTDQSGAREGGGLAKRLFIAFSRLWDGSFPHANK